MKINASVIFDLIGFYADLNLYLVRILDVIIIISKHQRQCFITFLNTATRGENMTHSRVFLMSFKVMFWKCDEIHSQVLVISSQSKLKLESEQGNKIILLINNKNQISNPLS